MSRFLILTLLLVLTGCDSPTGGDTNVQLAGTWNYSGVQGAPSLTFEGTLQINQQNGADFSGSAEVRESDAQGTIRNRAGQVSGRVIGGSDVVDFDIVLDGIARRHVGRVSADSMGGTWGAATTPATSGAFSAKRRP